MAWKRINPDKFDMATYNRFWNEEARLQLELDSVSKEVTQPDGSKVRIYDAAKYSKIWSELERVKREFKEYFESCLE